MKAFVDNEFFGEFATITDAQEILTQTEIPLDSARFEARPNEARRLCADHIASHYPEWKQLNVLRVGSEEEKAQMSDFIDACRAWSNSDAPNPGDLALIQP